MDIDSMIIFWVVYLVSTKSEIIAHTGSIEIPYQRHNTYMIIIFSIYLATFLRAILAIGGPNTTVLHHSYHRKSQLQTNRKTLGGTSAPVVLTPVNFGCNSVHALM